VKSNIDADELREISKNWGTQWADALIADRRWPRCDQKVVVAKAGAIVGLAIAGIAAILSEGDDFKPHLKMISSTVHDSFWNSMPSIGIGGR
jgi:hypothetical protein